MTEPRMLMCRPDHYGIEYEINAWMSRHRPADRRVAMRQWIDLRAILSEAGARIDELEPVAGLPDLVFTANAAMIYQQRAIMARFRPVERRQEVPHDEAWFREHGFEIHHVPEDTYFEGAGDALFCGETLFAGYRVRSDARGQQQIGELVGCRVIPLELVDPHFYHLDTCFCPLSPTQALWYPPAFDKYGRKVLAEMIDELIAVDDAEARRFGCNAVVVGRMVVTNTGCPRLHDELRRRDFEPCETPLDEFVKSGGSAKCLTLRLDGEEAAAWKDADEQATIDHPA